MVDAAPVTRIEQQRPAHRVGRRAQLTRRGRASCTPSSSSARWPRSRVGESPFVALWNAMWTRRRLHLRAPLGARRGAGVGGPQRRRRPRRHLPGDRGPARGQLVADAGRRLRVRRRRRRAASATRSPSSSPAATRSVDHHVLQQWGEGAWHIAMHRTAARPERAAAHVRRHPRLAAAEGVLGGACSTAPAPRRRSPAWPSATPASTSTTSRCRPTALRRPPAGSSSRWRCATTRAACTAASSTSTASPSRPTRTCRTATSSSATAPPRTRCPAWRSAPTTCAAATVPPPATSTTTTAST